MKCLHCREIIPSSNVQQGNMHMSCSETKTTYYKAFSIWKDRLDAEHEASTLNGEGYNINVVEIEMTPNQFYSLKEMSGY